MRRLLLLSTVLAASACTTEPQTDTGKLVRIHEQILSECEDGSGFTCGLQVSFADGRFTARGVTNDGAAIGPEAVGVLTEGARFRLDVLIAQIPLESPDTIHDVGCGLAPTQSTSADVAFDHDGMRHFAIEFASSGPMVDFSSYLNDLITGVRTCNSTELELESCTKNVNQF
jgi:hypothetical protein